MPCASMSVRTPYLTVSKSSAGLARAVEVGNIAAARPASVPLFPLSPSPPQKCAHAPLMTTTQLHCRRVVTRAGQETTHVLCIWLPPRLHSEARKNPLESHKRNARAATASSARRHNANVVRTPAHMLPLAVRFSPPSAGRQLMCMCTGAPAIIDMREGARLVVPGLASSACLASAPADATREHC